MDDAREMYQEHILDLYKYPHNFGKLEGTHKNRSYNPLCGDDITMQLVLKDGKIEDIKFLGRGCAICMASASLITDKAKGKEFDEIKKIGSEEVIDMLQIPIGPVRIKCALVPLEALQKC